MLLVYVGADRSKIHSSKPDSQIPDTFVNRTIGAGVIIRLVILLMPFALLADRQAQATLAKAQAGRHPGASAQKKNAHALKVH